MSFRLPSGISLPNPVMKTVDECRLYLYRLNVAVQEMYRKLQDRVDYYRYEITTTDDHYTIGNTEEIVVIAATAHDLNITLPSASNNNGRAILIKNKVSSTFDAILVEDGTDTVDTFTVTIKPCGYVEIVSDGVSNWYIINEYNIDV